MDFKKLGRYMVFLGIVLGCVSAYYAWLPYKMRWVEVEAIQDAIKGGGYSAKRAEIREQFESFSQKKFGFGVGAAISLFLGVAMIGSSKAASESTSE